MSRQLSLEHKKTFKPQTLLREKQSASRVGPDVLTRIQAKTLDEGASGEVGKRLKNLDFSRGN
jgi:hypothetical protein